MWSTINDVLGRNHSSKKSKQFVIDGEIITDDRIIATNIFRITVRDWPIKFT